MANNNNSHEVTTEEPITRPLSLNSSIGKDSHTKVELAMATNLLHTLKSEKQKNKLVNFLREDKNAEIRYKPVLVVQELLEVEEGENLKETRDTIKEGYFRLFNLDKKDSTIKKNEQRYRRLFIDGLSSDEVQKRFIDPIVELFPENDPWTIEATNELIEKLITNHDLGNYEE